MSSVTRELKLLVSVPAPPAATQTGCSSFRLFSKTIPRVRSVAIFERDGSTLEPHRLHRPAPWQHPLHDPVTVHAPIARHGHPGQAYCTSLALAEWLCGTADRIDPARLCGPHHYLGRGASAPNSEILRRLLQLRQNASILAQGCAGFSPGSANRCDQFTRHPGRTSSPLARV
jgi:hypothetical protein